jgi:hypothetical protein
MLNPDYSDMLRCFHENDVAFLVVGAYAMAVHGFPRATGDIDFWVEPTKENAPKVISSLKRFGAPVSDLSLADFATPNVVFQIGVAPCRIDILTSIDGVTFAEAWPHRTLAKVDTLTIPVLSIADLIRNKLASGREKDRLDVAELRRIGK